MRFRERETPMHRHEEAIEYLAALTSSAMITDRTCSLMPSAIAFTGSSCQFEDLLFRALNAALNVLPYQYVLDIALHMQREDIEARGIVLPKCESQQAA